jgi:hypothetical protein
VKNWLEGICSVDTRGGKQEGRVNLGMEVGVAAIDDPTPEDGNAVTVVKLILKSLGDESAVPLDAEEAELDCVLNVGGGDAEGRKINKDLRPIWLGGVAGVEGGVAERDEIEVVGIEDTCELPVSSKGMQSDGIVG